MPSSDMQAKLLVQQVVERLAPVLSRTPTGKELYGQLLALPLPASGPAIQDYIRAIVALPFPATLGLCDSREYDTACASVITVLEHIMRQCGLNPLAVPNAPQTAKPVHQGSLVWFEGGSARAADAHGLEQRRESQAAAHKIAQLDSTAACKAALQTRFPHIPAAAWKRKAKTSQGERVIRTFISPAGEAYSVIFDANSATPLQVVAGEATKPRAGAFPQLKGGNFSGRTLWGYGDNADDRQTEYIDFYCGPEEDGHLCDHENYDTALYTALFPGYKAEFNAAENYHLIHMLPGQTPKQLRDVVRDVLTKAGASMEV